MLRHRKRSMLLAGACLLGCLCERWRSRGHPVADHEAAGPARPRRTGEQHQHDHHPEHDVQWPVDRGHHHDRGGDDRGTDPAAVRRRAMAPCGLCARHHHARPGLRVDAEAVGVPAHAGGHRARHRLDVAQPRRQPRHRGLPPSPPGVLPDDLDEPDRTWTMPGGRSGTPTAARATTSMLTEREVQAGEVFDVDVGVVLRPEVIGDGRTESLGDRVRLHARRRRLAACRRLLGGRLDTGVVPNGLASAVVDNCDRWLAGRAESRDRPDACV